MADLTDIQAAGSTKIIGSDATGLETNPVNATANGGLHTNLRDASGNEIGVQGNQLKTADILNAGTGVQGALTVGTSAVPIRVGGSNLALRKLITLHNNSLVTIYWGYTNAVTTSTGTPIYAGQADGWSVGPNQDVYVIAGTAGNNTRITEAA